MSRIAVIGGGISGLSAAWLLSRSYDVILFERQARLGGHTHTHRLDTPDGPLALDTGFIVHNDRTYPLLVRLFTELGVATLDSDMSFGVTDPKTGFEYSTRNLNGLFADRRNVVRPGHYALLFEMLRFNRLARLRATTRFGEAGASSDATDTTLGDFLAEHRFAGELVERYLAPLASAIWSASVDTIRAFPLMTLVRFFDQHGMLNVLDHPVWKVVRGGSATYVPKLVASPRVTVETGATPRSVRRTPAGVEIEFDGRPRVVADLVVFACHGDEVLPLLADPTPAERDVFGAFRTTSNEAWLHTDARALPVRPAARAAWNYRLGSAEGTEGATVTYHLNRLQRLNIPTDYCVTLNPGRFIDPSKVVAGMVYTHPLYTRAAVAAQARWADVSGHNLTHYCGAYWFYGFHEDGLRSGVRVAEACGVKW